jgi:hypothetical protein
VPPSAATMKQEYRIHKAFVFHSSQTTEMTNMRLQKLQDISKMFHNAYAQLIPSANLVMDETVPNGREVFQSTYLENQTFCHQHFQTMQLH